MTTQSFPPLPTASQPASTIQSCPAQPSPADFPAPPCPPQLVRLPDQSHLSPARSLRLPTPTPAHAVPGQPDPAPFRPPVPVPSSPPPARSGPPRLPYPFLPAPPRARPSLSFPSRPHRHSIPAQHAPSLPSPLQTTRPTPAQLGPIPSDSPARPVAARPIPPDSPAPPITGPPHPTFQQRKGTNQ